MLYEVITDGCVYCKILKGEIPAHFIYEDDLVIAFLNLEQPNPYKVLVISRAHVETIYDLTDEQASAIFKARITSYNVCYTKLLRE